jgi:hypothetical protein
VNIGSRHAARATDVTEAETAAHNILNELLAGIRPWQSNMTAEPVDPFSSFDYRLSIEPVGLGNLVSVTVSIISRPVEQIVDAARTTSASLGTEARERFRLTRWVRRDKGSMVIDEGFAATPRSPQSP